MCAVKHGLRDALVLCGARGFGSCRWGNRSIRDLLWAPITLRGDGQRNFRRANGLCWAARGYVNRSQSKSMKIQKINSIFMGGSQFPITGNTNTSVEKWRQRIKKWRDTRGDVGTTLPVVLLLILWYIHVLCCSSHRCTSKPWIVAEDDIRLHTKNNW